jgi:DNA recombination protein RmuC
MTTATVLALLIGLLVGIVLGAVTSWVVWRARHESRGAHQHAQAEQSRAELASAQTQVAQAQSEAAQSRAEAAQARSELARTQQTAAEARAEASATQAESAEVSANLAKATAERDNALQRAQEIAADRETMANQFKALSSATMEQQTKQHDATADARLKATEQLMTPVRESLDKFNTRLTEVEKERAAMTTDLRAQVQNVRQTGETLRQETASLATALRKPQVRGAWGEMQLKRVAETAGMIEHCDFDLQATAQTDDRTMRPDMRVNLAEGKYLFVDAKVPLSSFLDASQTHDETQREQHLQRFAKNVKSHIDQLSSKQYWKAAESPEFVVMFLPGEAFFATALELMPDLHDYAARRDVVVATPTTLIGMLRAVAYSWRQAALAESAAEVFRLGRELHEKLGLLGNRFDKLGRALQSSVKSFNEAIATMEGTVLVRARKFTDLKVSETQLTAPNSVDGSVRQIQAPELVDNAAGAEPMIGRSSRRNQPGQGMAPETGELSRSDPGVFDLVDSQAASEESAGETGS